MWQRKSFYQTRIFDPFLGTPGVKRGIEWGKRAHLLTNRYRNLQIWSQHEKIYSGNHFHHTRIFHPFWGTPGVKRGTKWPKPSHLLTFVRRWEGLAHFVVRTYKFGDIQHEKFDGGIHFHHTKIFYPFWGPQRSKGAQNWVNVPISSQVIVRTSNLQIWYSAWEILWWHPFSPYCNI